MEFIKPTKIEKDSEKTDWTALLKTSLPLSPQTYEKLNAGLRLGHLKWKNLPTPLKYAYEDFDKEERQKVWDKGLEEGKWLDWD